MSTKSNAARRGKARASARPANETIACVFMDHLFVVCQCRESRGAAAAACPYSLETPTTPKPAAREGVRLPALLCNKK
ncbi:MAG TPA: hypothetical protein VF064_11380 [Pyrinomonadaceae bacterium]